MKHRKLKIIASILLGSVVIGGLTGCKRHSPEEKAEWIQYKISKKLELNETQKQKLKAVFDEGLKFHMERKAKRPQLAKDIKSMITSDSLSGDQIIKLTEDHRKETQEIIPVVAEKLVDFQKSLSTEQRNQLVEIFDKFAKRMTH